MHDELDLMILDSGSMDHAIAVARCGCDLAIERIGCEDLAQLAAFRGRIAAAAEGTGRRPADADLLKFGRTLFGFVVRESVSQVYSRLPHSHIRLQICSDRPDIQSLPWEYLQQPNTPPGPNSLRSVVRIIPTIGIDAPSEIPRPKTLRVLFVYADPIDQEGVLWDDIRSTIQREFAAYAAQTLQMDIVEGTSPHVLQNALNANAYDILHFAGHGQIDPTGNGSLLLVDLQTRRGNSLPASDLALMLSGSQVRVMVLSACNTSAGDFAKEFAVVAKTLVKAGVPAVIANQFPITNSIAAKFSGAFYRALIKTGDLDHATTQGRVALAIEPSLASGGARFEWGIPTLYRHVRAARAFQV